MGDQPGYVLRQANSNGITLSKIVRVNSNFAADNVLSRRRGFSALVLPGKGNITKTIFW